MQYSRRNFLIVTAAVASSLTIARHAGAQPNLVQESDANAQALGYKTDASHVDRAKYPKFQPGEACANCQFFQAKAGDATAPCTIFGGKQVYAKGWCSAYVKKA